MAEHTLTPTQSEQVRTAAEARGESEHDRNRERDAAAIAATLDAGECPWCDDYAGEYPGRHASSAHPEAWSSYSERE